MKYDLNRKIFKSVNNTENGEVGEGTIFHYHQSGINVWAEYDGGSIKQGHLIAIVLESGQLDMYYHHINDKGQMMIGKCLSIPEFTKDDKLLFKEQWQWLNGDKSSGHSEIVEV